VSAPQSLTELCLHSSCFHHPWYKEYWRLGNDLIKRIQVFWDVMLYSHILTFWTNVRQH